MYQRQHIFIESKNELKSFYRNLMALNPTKFDYINEKNSKEEIYQSELHMWKEFGCSGGYGHCLENSVQESKR